MARHIKRQMENLLQVIDLEEKGEAVAVDEIDVHPFGRADGGWTPEVMETGGGAVHYEEITAYQAPEPRLLMIARLLKGLLPMVDFRSEGRRVAVDGFRLKNLKYWAGYPSSGMLENFGEFSSVCNCDCEICFLKGSAVDQLKKSNLSLREAETRLRYYSPENRTGLLSGYGQPGEPMLNPRALDFLRMAREAEPSQPLRLTTNGTLLTEEKIKALADLKPVALVVSLNSADPEIRTRIMGTRQAPRGIEAIPRLREHGIQFIGSIVAPASLSLSDVEKTARFLDRYEALQIRLLLPGFTRFHDPALHFDTRRHWDDLVGLAQSLRKELRTPFMINPSYYWNQDITAKIDGIYPNSPAERAGLRFGDQIVEIDGKPVATKAAANYLLARSSKGEEADPRRRNLMIRRKDATFAVQLVDDADTWDDRYPYKPRGYPPEPISSEHSFGIHLIDGFYLETLVELEEIVTAHPEARKVLLFTTPLVKSLFAQAASMMGGLKKLDAQGAELRVTMAEHRFWGGNIMIGDLHVVQDYIDHLTDLADMGYRPDLALIPGSFVGEWGYDVMGRSFAEIERETGVRVALLNNPRVVK
jgi:molybdenum cofactor biosynthesis enzyme MoaA